MSFFVRKPVKNDVPRQTKDNAVKLQKRLASFSKNRKWISKKNYIQLATAGFSYSGVGDKVECEICLKRVFQWETDDDPLETHFRISPDCIFLKILGYSLDLQIPKYRKQSKYDKRLETMEKVPREILIDLPSFDSLALSGFFYQGTLDRMSCFHCGVVLRDWEKDTIPNEVHTQFGNKCLFIANLLEREKNGMNLKLKLMNTDDPIISFGMQLGKNEKIQSTELQDSQIESGIATNRCSKALAQPLRLTAFRPNLSQQSTYNFIHRPIGRFAVPRQLEIDVVEGVSNKSCNSNDREKSKPKFTLRPSRLSTQSSAPRKTECVTSSANSVPVITQIEQAVHEMGYRLELIYQAITEKRERGESDFPDATSLCLAVMDLAEKTSTS